MNCETVHNRPVPAESWSWLFGRWLCKACLDMLTAVEAQRCPGAYTDHRERLERKKSP